MQSLLFGFRGRINRAKFWMVAILSTIVIAVIFSIFFGGLAASGDPGAAVKSVGLVGGIIALLLYILLFWISLAIAVKRCHDRNRSGWFVLVGMVPVLNIWYLIEVGFLRGTQGPNNYGEDPLGAR